MKTDRMSTTTSRHEATKNTDKAPKTHGSHSFGTNSAMAV